MTVFVFLGSLLGCIFLGIPVAFSLLLCGLALMVQLNMVDLQIMAQYLITGADSFPLLAIPFFVLAGELMNAGGISRRIVEVADALVGHVRGGLGYVAVMAAIIMAPTMIKPAARIQPLPVTSTRRADSVPSSAAVCGLPARSSTRMCQVFMASVWPLDQSQTK